VYVCDGEAEEEMEGRIMVAFIEKRARFTMIFDFVYAWWRCLHIASMSFPLAFLLLFIL
jgi:hypothetical protein